jgi:hypothetical protein
METRPQSATNDHGPDAFTAWQAGAPDRSMQLLAASFPMMPTRENKVRFKMAAFGESKRYWTLQGAVRWLTRLDLAEGGYADQRFHRQFAGYRAMPSTAALEQADRTAERSHSV